MSICAWLSFDAFLSNLTHFILAVHLSRAPPIICVFIFCKTTVNDQHAVGYDAKSPSTSYDAKSVISTVNCDDRKAYENDYGLFQVRVFVYLRVLKKMGFIRSL